MSKVERGPVRGCTNLPESSRQVIACGAVFLFSGRALFPSGNRMLRWSAQSRFCSLYASMRIKRARVTSSGW